MAEKRKTLGDEPDAKKSKIDEEETSTEVQRLLILKAKLQDISNTGQQEGNAEHSTSGELFEQVLEKIHALKNKLQRTKNKYYEGRKTISAYRILLEEYDPYDDIKRYFKDKLKRSIKEQDSYQVEKLAKLQRVYDFNTHPLYHACLEGDLEIVDMVLKASDVYFDYDVEKSPMHVVCVKHNEPKAYHLMRMLLQAGILSLAHARRDEEQKVIAENCLDCLQIAIKRKNPLHTCVERSLIMSRLDGVVWLLVNQGLWIYETCEVDLLHKTVWQLCEGDLATRSSLRQFWTPKNHCLHKKHVRNNILLVLLISKRNNWNFDTNIMHLILGFVAYEAIWIVEETEDKPPGGVLPKRKAKHESEYYWVKSASSNSKVRWKLDVQHSNPDDEETFNWEAIDEELV